MVYCKISELPRYILCSANMKKAIDFIISHDLDELPFGKTIIDGDKVFLNKSKTETKRPDELKYESHQRYIDIQIDLDGDEKVFITNGICESIRPFNVVEDYALYSFSEPSLVAKLDNTFCAIILRKSLTLNPEKQVI